MDLNILATRISDLEEEVFEKLKERIEALEESVEALKERERERKWIE